MIKDLEFLIKLQEIDQRIHELELSKQEFPKEVADLEKIVENSRSGVAAFDKKNTEALNQQKTIEQQIVDAKAALKKSEERLNSITTNREYDAVHAEIETHKHTIANGGNKLKAVADEFDKIHKGKEESQTAYEKVTGESQPRIDDLTARIASIDSDIAVVRKERDAAVKEIAPPVYRMYANIYRRRKNARIIGFVNETCRVCKICFKVLEPQLINEIRKATKTHLCEACGSLLIWHEEESVPSAVASDE
jgi:predicted  nucleic acid-binding Zn-ribbon protein